MTKQTETQANIELVTYAQASAWVVGKNFAAKKPVAKKDNSFTTYLKKRGIIAFRQSAKTA